MDCFTGNSCRSRGRGGGSDVRIVQLMREVQELHERRNYLRGIYLCGLFSDICKILPDERFHLSTFASNSWRALWLYFRCFLFWNSLCLRGCLNFFRCFYGLFCSFAALISCSRWAFLTSGFIFFLAMMSVIEAPKITYKLARTLLYVLIFHHENSVLKIINSA